MIRRYSLATESLATAVLSFLLACLLRPDFFLSAAIRFTAGHDMELPFQGAFIHAGYFINGAVDIWNRYDQATHAYIHLGTTFHSPVAVIEGAFFAVLHTLFDRPGEAFQHFHALAFFFLACLVRTVGGVALLSLYNVGPSARIISLILLNTLVAIHTYDGALSGFAYSLAPLVFFYIAVLGRSRTPVALGLAVAAYCSVFATIPLLSLGYGYMPIHFVVVASCVFVLHDVWRTRAPTRRWSWEGPRLDLGTRGRVVMTAIFTAAAWIVATNLYYLNQLVSNFFVAGSGLGETDGRFSRMLRPFAIFEHPFTGPRPEDALFGALNFERNDWWQTWMFVGAAVVGFFTIGLAISKRREKWIYLAATMLTVFAAQFQPNQISLGWIAHAVTAFTNPFAFLIRDTQQSSLLISYLMWPVVAFGIEAILKVPNGRPTSYTVGSNLRCIVASIALMGLIVYASLKLPPAPAVVSSVVFLCLLAAVLGPLLRSRYRMPSLRFLPITMVLVAVACDLGAFSKNLMHVPYTGDLIQPRLFAGLEKLGPIVIDYQNPAIRPLPRHMYVGPADEIAGPRAPTTDPTFPTEFAIYFTAQDDPGAFYHTIFASRYFYKPRTYEQRGIRFKGADTDVPLQQHMRRNDRYIYHASVALDARTSGLRAIVDADADGFATVLEDPSGAPVAGLSPVLVRSSAPMTPPAAPLRFEWAGKDAGLRVRRELVEFEVRLPANFPNWISTTVFGKDSDAIRLVVDGQTFLPAQGHLIRPFTFDVGNVRTGHLVFALSTAAIPRSIQLEVDQDPLIRDVTDLRSDRLSLKYQAPSNGWMVIRSPHQEGWSATVNDMPVPVYVANGTAMAVPVKEGLNQVTLAFKPGFSAQRVLVVGYLFFGPLLLFLVAGLSLHIAGRIRKTDPVGPNIASA